ncbi:uncharacterized protein BDV17DRAFT_300217 [Aspergillus undulatus]|uniref:uncharacterized protein n=1 Tax=Aspergillus undulatus TaxID=1810928 RepID=UPI003CCDD7DE
MRTLAIFAASIWLFLHLAVASPNYSELVRVPRDVWDTDLAARDDTDATSVGLSDHETFKWASTDAPNSKAVVVSMVAYAKQDERILDMDKFSFALESATCTAEDFSITFKNFIIYAAAKIAWQWVNYNDLRSFVLVLSWKGCAKDNSHIPWVVRGVTFDDTMHRVIFDATESTWKTVMSSFVLDFQEVVLDNNGTNDKRDIIPDLDEKFRLNLEATLPREIFQWQVRNPPLNGTLTANCNNCGTSGTMVFAGHVEATLGFGEIDVDKFEITVTPQGVQAHVGLSLEFEGELDYRQFVKPSQDFEVLEIPVSGWNIPGIFEFGPRILLNAGYVIDYIGGNASVSTGITARIPDSSIAKLDMLAEDQLQTFGWAPVIETDPLGIQAMIDAQARLYTEIALSVSLTVLDDNGFGVDLALKVPELTITAASGHDTMGFCEGSGDPFGVNIDANVGANLVLEAWRELSDNRDTLFTATLFEKDDLYEFPQSCLSFGTLSEGYCLPELPVDGMLYEELTEEEIAEDEEMGELTARSLGMIDLEKRQRQHSRRPIYLNCGSGEDYKYKVLRYNSPTALQTEVTVPIVIPLVACSPGTRGCVPDTDIEVLTQEDGLVPRAAVFVKEEGDTRTWSTEHIYEGNWIKQYLDYLHTEKFGNNAECSEYVTQFWDKSKTPTANVPKPAAAQPPPNYIRSLLQNLGTELTQAERMVLLAQKQNNHKFNMFAKNELVFQDKDPQDVDNSHERRTCDLARIVTTCKYMDHEVVRKGLLATVVAIEGVLAEMDNDSNISKPADFSFVEAHQEWFENMYTEGIDHTRERLVEYATWMTNNRAEEWDALDDQAQEEIKEIATGSPDWAKYCPSRPREEW